MEQLDIPTADKTKREAELLGDLGPNPLSIGKVKTQFIPEDSSSTPLSYVDYVAPQKIHVDSSIAMNFPARSADSYFCSWEEKGKAILPDSSEMQIPPWIANEKSELVGYEAMKQCLQILFGRSTISIEVYAECLDCLAYCSLFPMAYEIEGDELLQLWMAAGLIAEEPMERIARGYLAALQEYWASFFSFLREDGGTGKKWYKVNKQLLTSRISIARVDYSHDPIQALATKTGPFHATFGYLSSNLDSLCSFTQMRTLLLLRGHSSSHIDHVPYGFFLKLKLLQALDLSGTKVSELPSSIGHAKCLRYLDLSQTLIKRLPETIDCLLELQTLKLSNCPRLIALPKAMSTVTSLRHLDLGTLCHLRSMPPGMGALTRLFTLSNFVVGRESGCCIGELKNMTSLTGRVCLSRLENVRSVEECKKANLHHKRGITKLELRWTDDLQWENIAGDGHGKEVVEHLLPSIMLEDLRILCYGGLKLPSWISKPSFYKLKSITLFKCENCQLLPSLGRLPSLEFLTLIEFIRVKIIDLYFYVETVHSDDVAFPKLQKLEIKSLLSLEEWRETRKVRYFPCLTKLVIKDCPQLTTICRLSGIHCLECLEINNCGKLPSLPEGGLPSSMKTLVIDDCPMLSLSCSSSLEKSQDWHKSEHTSSLLIYQRNEGKRRESASVTN